MFSLTSTTRHELDMRGDQVSDIAVVWSGKPEDFEEFYAWAGSTHQRNVIEYPATDDTQHRVTVFNSRDGWTEVEPGATVFKNDGGELSTAVARVIGSAVQVNADSRTEDKGSPAPVVETKPAEQPKATSPAAPTKKV